MPDSFLPGNILFIKNYDFGEGYEPKDKLIIILDSDDEKLTIIQVLTTSQDKGNGNGIKHGCNNNIIPYLDFYFFDLNVNVGNDNSNSDFKFHKDTFVYFNQNVQIISTINYLKYQNDISVLAKLYDFELTSLIKCICMSKLVSGEIKTILKNKIP